MECYCQCYCKHGMLLSASAWQIARTARIKYLSINRIFPTELSVYDSYISWLQIFKRTSLCLKTYSLEQEHCLTASSNETTQAHKKQQRSNYDRHDRDVEYAEIVLVLYEEFEIQR